ncbi:MAG: 30S ribosomal protein S20 [Patescibacteria group bacterium]|jgi:small subunit ribosomal protein S20
MPNLDNAKKALRQSIKNAQRNAVVMEELHSLRRQYRLLVSGKKLQEAEKLLSTIYKKADKAVSKGVIKKNAAARIKSRITVALKKAK